MNQYEMCVIMKPDLDDEAQQAELDVIQELIDRLEGTIEEVDSWGRRRLAYEIEKIGDGFYYFITFNAPADAPKEIKERVGIMENVLRYLIVRVED